MFSAVNFVPQNWMTEMLKMNSYLMSAATVKFAFN